MFVIRPCKEKDLDSLYELATLARAGLTTLPNDRELLKRRLEDALHSFKKKSARPGGEVYLFVMEDTESKKIVGTCSVISKIGGFMPSYTYKIMTSVKRSKVLNVEKKIKYLQLIKEHNGPSEVGTLFLSPEARQKNVGRLLSLSRFVFIAQYPHCFENKIIAEMRGVLDENNQSPFWNSVCKHFFEVEFEKADLMVMSDKSFIEDLIPEHPLYIPLLTYEAQNVIGKVHKNTKPALEMLLKEGFTINDEIDIFEAGPIVEAERNDIRTVRESKEAIVVGYIDTDNDTNDYLIANINDFEKFRVTMGNVEYNNPGHVHIPKEVASAIDVEVGDKVRVATSR